MTSRSSTPLKVFISYSHKSMAIKNELVRVLSTGGADYEILSDDLLKPGLDWNKSLTNMRNEADVFLLLVDNNYLQSDTIKKAEMPQVIKRAESGEAHIIPFIVDDSDWEKEEFARYQGLPKFGQPFLSIENKEQAYNELLEALWYLLKLKNNDRAFRLIKEEKKLRSGVLELKRCELDFIPIDLSSMPWLTSITLQHNRIEKIENIQNLPKLTHLDISNNAITTIKGVEALTALEFLDLEKNKISKIEHLEQNTNLLTLGISSNQLTSLDGLGPLKKLHTLYAGHNAITDIGELYHLQQLNRIVLTNNKITSLKPLLQHIKSGLKVALNYSFDTTEKGIFIKENETLAEPSIEVIEKGSDAILKYFGDAETYGTQKLEIFKLILVGNSKVGKTNLSEFLRGLDLTEKHQSTHLLDIQRWRADFLKSEKGEPMLVNIFDFGGQDYYHDSHKMFYSHDTAYILMWDTSTNKYTEEIEANEAEENTFIYENFPLEYWLESINYNLASKFSPSFKQDKQADGVSTRNTAPILVLQNKIDIEEGRLDQKTLSDKYTNIAGFFNVSLTTKKRTEIFFGVLNDYMKAMNLSGRLLIEYEYKIIQDYINHPRPFTLLSLAEFWEDCKRIIGDKTVEFNKDNARIIAEILNGIGVIFYEKTTADDGLVFTEITKLNEIIKEVMDIAKRGNDKGLFNKQQVDHISYKDEVLSLLARNNSIVAINASQYLVPQFLPTRPDPSIEFFLPAFTYQQVRFRYKAYFHKTLLLTLFSNYITESLSITKSLVSLPFWRNGIIIQRGEGSTRQMVLVEFLKNEKEGIINIKTMKPYNKRGLERDIETNLDKLNTGWTVCREISADSTVFFDVDHLKTEIEKGIFEFGANGKLFSANDFKNIADFDKLPKKLFISYSSKNAEFIKRFVTHLEVLKSAGMIEPWYDRMIESGTRWDDTIRDEMKKSDVIIFLLSPDFLATEYIMKTEIPVAIQQLKSEVSKFFFVELKPCGWKRTVIADYQQTDNSEEAAKNVITIMEPENDKMWNKVIDELVIKLEG